VKEERSKRFRFDLLVFELRAEQNQYDCKMNQAFIYHVGNDAYINGTGHISPSSGIFQTSERLETNDHPLHGDALWFVGPSSDSRGNFMFFAVTVIRSTTPGIYSLRPDHGLGGFAQTLEEGKQKMLKAIAAF
jgi:hypothetical protein